MVAFGDAPVPKLLGPYFIILLIGQQRAILAADFVIVALGVLNEYFLVLSTAHLDREEPLRFLR